MLSAPTISGTVRPASLAGHIAPAALRADLRAARLTARLGAAKVNGTLSTAALVGSVGLATGYPTYTGATEVTPSKEAQVLDTSGKVVLESITVNPIPKNYGLITWNGSTLTVS